MEKLFIFFFLAAVLFWLCESHAMTALPWSIGSAGEGEQATRWQQLKAEGKLDYL